MDPAAFDRFADEYDALHAASLGASGEDPAYFAAYKARDLHEAAQALGLPPAPAILDFGAGIGSAVPHLLSLFAGAAINCVDVSERSLAIGRSRFGDQASFVGFDGRTLPFDDRQFDIVTANCVFHHIAPAMHGPLLGQILRVLRPGGIISIYEHNPLNPLTVRAVNACAFDADAMLINAGSFRARVTAAGFVRPRLRHRVFFPRALAMLRPLEAWLGWLPLGAQYHLIAMRPADG